MVLSLLDLPREIRDLIYNFALTSPTDHLLLTLHKRPRTPRFPSSTGVRLQPCNPSNSHPIKSLPRPTTALQRTSRQIRGETHDWIWKHNTICFQRPADAIAVFKHMGQRPSRLVEKVQLHVPYDEWLREGKKILLRAQSMLASRTRRGNLREVRLVLDVLEDSIRRFFGKRLDVVRGFGMPRYRELLSGLLRGPEAGWDLGKVERRLAFQYDLREDVIHWPEDMSLHLMENVAQELHCAWGGKLICNGKIIWDNYDKVGRIPPTAAPISVA